MLLLSILVLVAGVVVLVGGLRGRVIGDDPHCANCGFNLRGRDPTSTRCPECGAELGRGAITDGLRQRRPRLIVIGALTALIGGAIPTLVGLDFVRNINWAQLKPASWLFSDLDSTDSRTRTDARRELRRRVDLGILSAAATNDLLDRILALQADQSKKWDPNLGDLFEAAAWTKRVDAQRLERYLRQGVTARLEVKPKIRRGQLMTVHLQLDCDRYSSARQLRGTWETSELTLGGGVMRKENWACDLQDDQLAGRIGYSTSIDSTARKHFPLADGKYEANATVKMTLSMTSPALIGPVAIDLPLSAPVELVPAYAIVDEFKIDPALRDQMQQAFARTRVSRRDGKLFVELIIAPLPVDVAGEVILVQGGKSHRVGAIQIGASRQQSTRSLTLAGLNRPAAGSIVDVHVRPTQEAADGKRTLGTYWGEEIIMPNVRVEMTVAVPSPAPASPTTSP